MLVNGGTISGSVSGVIGQTASVTLVNDGTVLGGSGAGVVLSAGGSVTNVGTGVIEGVSGLVVTGASASIFNAGSIVATGSKGVGVLLKAGGTIANNGAATALILGNNGVFVSGGVGVVRNTGTIRASGTANAGIYLGQGGTIGNNLGALIEGGSAIRLKTAGTVFNGGSIVATGTNGTGVILMAGGRVVNGKNAGMIEGSRGIVVSGGVGVIANGNTIRATGTANPGIYLGDGGTITNVLGALIEGASAIRLEAAGTVTNLGGIVATAATGTGVLLMAGGSIANSGTIDATGNAGQGIYLGQGGSVSNRLGGLIEGTTGVFTHGAGTVSNVGTIASTAGAGGIAVRLGAASDVLIDFAGAVFTGLVEGGGGTLELTGRTGTLTGLGSSVTGFGTIDLIAGAAWDTIGAETATGALIDAGTLVDQGTLTLRDGGTLASTGTVSGTGTLVLAGGTAALGSGLDVARVVLSGGTAVLGASLTDSDGFTQSGGTLALGTHELTLEAAAGFSGGTVTGTGYLVTRETAALAHLTLGGGLTWQVFGTVSDTGTLTLGAFDTSDRLTVETGGAVILAGNEQIVTAAGGTGAVANAGLIKKTAGAGRAVIAPTVGNSGTIMVNAGTLELEGGLTGTGSLSIGHAATLTLDGSVGSGQHVGFAVSTGGVLVLNDAAAFAGTVAGLGGSDKLDLASLSYAGNTHPGWVQQGTGGTLTVTEGATTLHIKLFGQYVAAGFTAQQDGSGTLISYTTPVQDTPSLTPPHR